MVKISDYDWKSNRLEVMKLHRPILILSVCCLLGMSSVNADFCKDVKQYVNLNATTKKRLLTSPGYPKNYGKGLYCKWLITAPTKDYVIRIDVIDTRLEPSTACYSDYVTVFDGRLRMFRQLSKWCGRRGPKYPIVSSRPRVLVQFKTNTRNEYRGFALHYWAERRSIMVSKPAAYSLPHLILFLVFLTIVIVVYPMFSLYHCIKSRRLITLSSTSTHSISIPTSEAKADLHTFKKTSKYTLDAGSLINTNFSLPQLRLAGFKKPFLEGNKSGRNETLIRNGNFNMSNTIQSRNRLLNIL